MSEGVKTFAIGLVATVLAAVLVGIGARLIHNSRDIAIGAQKHEALTGRVDQHEAFHRDLDMIDRLEGAAPRGHRDVITFPPLRGPAEVD